VERNLYCTVVEVPVVTSNARRAGSARDLSPWADPYIAGLIRKLQDEVRAERTGQTVERMPQSVDPSPLRNEAVPRNGDGRLEFDAPDYDAWRHRGETPHRRF
jgi:hypothetical protein